MRPPLPAGARRRRLLAALLACASNASATQAAYRVRTLVEPTPEPAAAGQPLGGVPVGGGFAPR
jgi:hypothetical protein